MSILDCNSFGIDSDECHKFQYCVRLNNSKKEVAKSTVLRSKHTTKRTSKEHDLQLNRYTYIAMHKVNCPVAGHIGGANNNTKSIRSSLNKVQIYSDPRTRSL